MRRKNHPDGFDLGKDVAKTLLPSGTVEAGELEAPDQSTHPAWDRKGAETVPESSVCTTRVHLNRTMLPCSEKRRAEGMKKNRKR